MPYTNDATLWCTQEVSNLVILLKSLLLIYVWHYGILRV